MSHGLVRAGWLRNDDAKSVTYTTRQERGSSPALRVSIEVDQ